MPQDRKIVLRHFFHKNILFFSELIPSFTSYYTFAVSFSDAANWRPGVTIWISVW